MRSPITPNGKTAYVANRDSNTVTPITIATGTAGTPIAVGSAPTAVAVTPDGKTAYVANGASNTITPIAVATGKTGTPIPVGADPVALVISPDEAPVASFDATEAAVGSPTGFDASDSTPGLDSSAISTYAWTFGDGVKTTTTVPTVSHTYAAVGTYTVTLTLKDVLGTTLGTQVFTGQTMSRFGPPGARATQQLQVYAKAGGPPPTAYVVAGNTVIPINTATRIAGAPIAVGANPNAIAITPDGKTAWVTSVPSGNPNQGTGTVTPISTATRAAGTPVTVGIGPDAIAITPDGKTAYVVNSHAAQGQNFGSVTPINTATHTAGTPITVGSLPTAIAITPDGKTAWVTEAAGTANQSELTPINIAAGTAGTPVPFNTDSALSGIAITPDGRTAWVTNELLSGTATGFNTATHTFGSSAVVGSEPVDIRITPDGTTAYVANFSSGSVTQITTATAAASPIAVGNNPIAIAITPDGKIAYVANQGTGSISRIHTATRIVGAPITLGANPRAIAITPDQAPVASFSATPAAAGSPSSFDASGSSAPSSPIASYAWTFGDGALATTTVPTASHTYASAGTYTVTLTVRDAAGTSTTRVFTGQTMSDNGGARAQTSRPISVP